MAVRTGLEPVISRVTGERDNHYTNEPWLRGPDLNQQPLGYEPSELPDCSIPRYHYDAHIKWRRKRDSNPCADFSTSRFSRPVPSTRLGYSSKKHGASGRTRTDMSFYTRRILSPVRLPIPPLRHKNGVSLEIRTPDPLIKSQVLYRLS